MRMFTIVFLLIFEMSWGQNSYIKWTEPVEAENPVFLQHFTNIDIKHYFTVYYDKKKNLFITKCFDNELNLLKKQVVVKGLEGYGYNYFSFAGNNRLFHVMAEDVKRNENANIEVVEHSDTIKAVEEENNLHQFHGNNWLRPHKMLISKNRAYVMMQNIFYEPKTKNNNCSYKVFNTIYGTLLHEGSFAMPALKDKFESFTIDDNGNVYFIVKRGIGFRVKDREDKAVIELLVYNTKGEKKSFQINPLLMLTSRVDILANNESVYILGMLNFKAKQGGNKITSQLLLQRFDITEMRLFDMHISSETEGLYPDKKLNDYDKLAYKVNAIHRKSNGNLVLVAEQTKDIANISTGTLTTEYFDIAAIEIDDKFRVLKTTRLSKYQFSKPRHQLSSDFTESFVSTMLHDTLYLVYSDALKNLTVVNDSDTKNTSSNNSKNGLFIVRVAGDGEPEKELVYSYNEQDIIPQLLKSFEVKPGLILLSAQDRLGLLNIQDK